MKWPTSLLLLLCAAPVYSADAPALLDLLPPNPQIVFGTRVRAVMDSSLVRSLSAQLQGSTADMQKIIPILGFDPLQDVDEILLTSTGTGENPPVLIVARGKFNPSRVTAQGRQYQGVSLFSESETADTGFAFLDESTVVAGDLSEVKAVIDRRGSVAESSPILARIGDYRQRYALWGIADKPGALAKRLPNSAQSQALDSIDRFQFGIALTNGLEIAAEVHPRSAEDATQLTASLKLFEALLKASQPSLDKGTKLSVGAAEDGSLKVSIAISEEELKKAIQTRGGASPFQTSGTPSKIESAKKVDSPAAPVKIGSAATATPAASVKIESAETTAPSAPVKIESAETTAPSVTSAARTDAVVLPASDSGTVVFRLPGRR